MPTLATFYTQPTNIDHLIPTVRIMYGDIDGSIYSDTIIRTALVSAIHFLQARWDSKYQVYRESMRVSPQPDDIPSGYMQITTIHGLINVPDTLSEGDVFRNPYITFLQASLPVLESIDEMAIILAAVYILRRAQTSSNAGSFVSWSTEDIRYSNTSAERSLSKLVDTDLIALNSYFSTKIARPQRSVFPIGYIPVLTELL